MKKRLSGILLSLALMLTMMPVLGLSQTGYAEAESESPYGLWIGGVAVTYENKGDVMSDGTVSFTPAEGGGAATLTLNGANIKEGYIPGGETKPRGIYYDGTAALDIVLPQDSVNTVDGRNDSPFFIGIEIVNANASITGKGKLSVFGINKGLHAGGSVTIDGSTVEAAGTGSDYYRGDGIISENLVIENGSVDASGTGSDSNAIYAQKTVTINGGTVNASASGSDSYGIYAGSGGNTGIVNINAGTVTASGHARAILGSVKNDIAGTGWPDVEQTGDPEFIGISTTGRSINYKAVEFRTHSHDDIKFRPWTSSNSLPTETGSYYLTTDVTMGSPYEAAAWTVASDKTIDLCLNGHGITATGRTIDVNGTLNLCDCDTVTEHKYKIDNGRAVIDDNGTLSFTGGYITGSSLISVVQVGGRFTMNGGTILGNKGTGVKNRGTFVMSGGSIIRNTGAGVTNDKNFEMSGGNVSGNSGGGVAVGAGTFEMSGGTISDNTGLAGVQVWGTFRISGSPKIIGNQVGSYGKKQNVFLYQTYLINIDGSLDEGMTPIGVTTASNEERVFTGGWNTHMGDADPADYFTSDNADYCVAKDGNELKMVKHTHVFTYTADGDTITADCSADDCPLPGKKATLTIAASDGIYDGTTAYEASVADKYGIRGSAEVNYFKAKDDGTRGDPLTEAPKNAGKYWAEITVGTSGNSATAHVVYSIARATPTAKAPSGSATYGQTLADVTLDNPQGNTPGKWAWNAPDTSVGGVGENTFKANFTPTDSANYEKVTDVNVTVNVGKADNPATVTGTASVRKGGKTIELSDNVSLNGAAGDVSYAFSGDEKGCSLTEGGKLTSGNTEGDVEVSVTVGEDGNYKASAAMTITVTVTPKLVQTITTDDVTAVYGDTDKKVSAVTDGDGAISYKVKAGSGEYIGVGTSDGVLTIKSVPASGKAYVVATAAETADYQEAVREVTVSIGKADNPATVTGTASVRKGGKTIELSDNVSLNGAAGDVSYAFSGDAKGCSLTKDGKLTSGNTEGDVEVSVTVGEDGNYKASAAMTITVTVTPKLVQTITTDDVTAVYGDTDKKVSAVTDGDGAISYKVKAGSGEYIGVGTSDGVLTIRKVPADGKAHVVVTAAETADYQEAVKEVTVTIDKAKAVPAAVTANDRKYDGNEAPLVTVRGKAEGGEMQYAPGTDDRTAPVSGWSTSIPNGTDAGDYHIWYKAVGDGNHTDSDAACVTVTIAEKTDPAPGPGPGSKPGPAPVPSKAKPVSAVKGTASGRTSLRFTWNRVSGAASYEIWMSRCNTAKRKYSVKKIKTLGAGRTTFIKKGLKKNTAYKFRVVARDASGRIMSKSLICHAYTGDVGGGYTNAKSLKVSKKSYTLKKGGTAKIKATQTKARKGRKLCNHAKLLRYKSSNPSVARVSSSGKITAAGAGSCKVYVQTVNGIWKTIKVNVK